MSNSPEEISPASNEKAINLPELGRLIQLYRLRKGMPRIELADMFKMSHRRLADIEIGRLRPRPDLLVGLCTQVCDTPTEANELLALSGYEPKPVSRWIELGLSPSISVDAESVLTVQNQEKLLESQFQTLVVQLKEQDNATLSSNQDSTQAVSSTITDEVQLVQESLTAVRASSESLTVPVAIPTRESMRVRLVPVTYLERLEEYRAEETVWFSWAGIFLGAVLGIIINVMTGGKLERAGWIIGGAFVVLTILLLWFAFWARKNGQKQRAKLVDEPIYSE